MSKINIISLKNIEKSFGKNTVLNGITCEIKKGEVVGIEGESGAGKTTLLKILVGYLDFDKGKISYTLKKKAYDLEELKKFAEFYSSVGFSNQECSFYDHLDVEENLSFYGAMYKLKKEEVDKRIKELLPLVNLTGKETILAGNLSAGMQKRLDLACALIHEPKIIFLDEPTAHLDEKNRRDIWKLIQKLNKRGITAVVTSHFSKDLKRYCNRNYTIKKGKLRCGNYSN
ncbi:MAG: ABC transporter ATP-binding protein [Candidatus Woesearchaeota archaeon]